MWFNKNFKTVEIIVGKQLHISGLSEQELLTRSQGGICVATHLNIEIL